jgi:protein SCO1/2
MSRIFLTTILFLGLGLTSIGQQKAPKGISIDEKLGDEVALDIVLKDESAQDVTLRQLVDKPTILIFNYLRCPGICPVLISNVVEVVNQMELEPGKDYRLVAVSFDPTDTPEMALQKKANYLNQLRRPFSPDAWRFLTGSAENTRAVADSTGYNYVQRGDMYEHPGAIIILTPTGIISRYMYGTSFLSADVAMAVQEAAGGQVRPTISKMLAFCYTYDPEGRGYVFSVTRFAGAVILALAIIFVIFIVRGKTRKKVQDS